MAKRKVTSSYAEKLKDLRWQKLRLQVLERKGWACGWCGADDQPLHIHHGYYKYGVEPWEYPIESLTAYCENCHASADQIREHARLLFGTMRCDMKSAVIETCELLNQLPFEYAYELLLRMHDLAIDSVRAFKNGDIDQAELVIMRK